jgi:cell division protein FtsI/penicillin-binding protein 2
MGSVATGKGAWRPALFLFLAASTLPQEPQPPVGTTRSLFSQSALEILRRDYATSETSYLLLDAKSGELLASHWENYEKPIPLGSLVKPFAALAYAEAHDFHYPIYECKGKVSGCWQDQLHGKLDITAAVSVSCNAYFRRLAENVSAEQLSPVTQAFGLEFPEAGFTSSNLIGLGKRWRISPVHMARAYLELYRRKEQPGVAPILEGMRRSALRGTGVAVDRQLKHAVALVKTGTAPCSHTPWAPADGFVLALVPADQPEILLLLRIHGVAGAKAAETAGRMLRQMEE